MEVAVEESKTVSALEDENVHTVVEGGGERGDDKVEGGIVIGDIVDDVYSSESDEGEEGIVIHAGRTTTQRQPQQRKSFGAKTYTRPDALSPGGAPQTSSRESKTESDSALDEELKKLRFLRHVTAFDIDINALEDHPWRNRNVDLLDYFNFGFNERTWMQYCEKQLRLRAQKGLGPYVPPPVTVGAPLPAAAPGTVAPLVPVAPAPAVLPSTVPAVPPHNPAQPPQAPAAPTAPSAPSVPMPVPPSAFRPPLGGTPALPPLPPSTAAGGANPVNPAVPAPPLPTPGFPGGMPMGQPFGMMPGQGQMGMDPMFFQHQQQQFGFPSSGQWGQTGADLAAGGWPGHDGDRDMYGRERGRAYPDQGDSLGKRKADGWVDQGPGSRRRTGSNSRDRERAGRAADREREVDRDFGRDVGRAGRDSGNDLGRDLGRDIPPREAVRSSTQDARGAREVRDDAGARDGKARDSSRDRGRERAREDSRDRRGPRDGDRDRDRTRDREKEREPPRDRDREARDRDRDRDREKERERDRRELDRDGRDGRREDDRGARRAGERDRSRSRDRRTDRDRGRR